LLGLGTQQIVVLSNSIFILFWLMYSMLYLFGFVGNARFLSGGPGSMIEERNGLAKAQAQAGARVRDDRGEGDHRQDLSD
jgi:hypothetical protein